MKEIIIHEVGPRDGLQAEKQTIPTEVKVKWIEALMESGVDIIQIGSFVHPEKVPQMADTDKLFTHFSQSTCFSQSGKKVPSVVLAGLVLNEKGLDRGMACGVELFCMGISASDTYSKKNTGMSSEEALSRIIPMAQKAVAAGKKVQVSVQNAFGCSYEGPIQDEKVLTIMKKYLEAGMRRISLADTSGHAHPQQVERLFGAAIALEPQAELTCHFHETYGLGIANCYAAMKAGVKYFEASFGGLGGSPFSARSSGNVCTEDFVHFLQRMDLRPDVRMDKIVEVTKEAGQILNRDLPSFMNRIGPVPAGPASQ